ncbi:Rho/Rac/Cdc42-like GTPases guanine nucleotide exchange factor [Encephalitozoon romaleae SJ-2008]|uniref:Rho/Rac/Cdc42-like GTPases guanine nucleotide exchange factor n=1 Tax=Encephalitozoon romaleae (strain SJ-2008) TaxID=1178016 RepID=I7ADM4_ENCRO|nr:Rho/Rac/Cdc42-like GTPases guanine nucleotide exchange factor [Encephalitozoon romaleae SJ-2008]AFN82665.1 Rho/Rac/Cdc42-like GTPases guanine nucleotide exchange factor [Encephalitozoon romaleae SJ-2008]
MSKSRKRIEAIGEIFKSEKSYIQDLLVWEKDFRVWILGYPLFSTPKIKYEICDRIFINLDRIQRLHKKIYEDMKRVNLGIYSEITGGNVLRNTDEYIIDKIDVENPGLRKLEYVSIYERYIEEFDLYNEYVRRLPKAEFELEKLVHRYPEFAKGVENFLKGKNAAFLGIKHFLYRPSQKLARYPLLLKAVVKNEEGNLKKEYERLIEKFKAIAKNVDKEFNKFGTQFAMYKLGINFRYKQNVKNQYCLALFQKKRKLLKEGEALVRGNSKEDSKMYKIFVFDHLILICDCPEDKFSEIYINEEPMFISRMVAVKENVEFFPEDPFFEKLFPLFLFERGGIRMWGLYFYDKGERDLYYNIIQKAILRIRSNLRNSITFKRLPFEVNETVRYACQANDRTWYDESLSSSDSLEYSTGTLSEESSPDSTEYSEMFKDQDVTKLINNFHRIRKDVASKEEKLDSEESQEGDEKSKEVSSRKRSLWKSFFPTADFFVSSIKIPPPLDRNDDPDYISAQKAMYIIAIGDGVYRLSNEQADKILDRRVEKIIYDSAYEIMLYQSGSTLYASHFNVESTSIEENVLKDDVDDFFYGITRQGPCIASTDSGDGKSVSIFLFLAVVSNDAITIELSRKLYIGLQVYNVFFCSEKIVIGCKDFEIVDMETLRTEELLQVYDPFIPILFHGLKNITARSIFPVSPHEFLLCFNTMGFVVDDTGKLKRTDIIFLWNCNPLGFKVVKNYVICLGRYIINIFDLKTGLLVFTKCQSKLRFVEGSMRPLLHDGRNFYEIMFGPEDNEKDTP